MKKVKYWHNKTTRGTQSTVNKGVVPLHGDDNGKVDPYGFYAVEISEAEYNRLYNLPADDTDCERRF